MAEHGASEPGVVLDVRFLGLGITAETVQSRPPDQMGTGSRKIDESHSAMRAAFSLTGVAEHSTPGRRVRGPSEIRKALSVLNLRKVFWQYPIQS
jgi:hypothetical protein